MKSPITAGLFSSLTCVGAMQLGSSQNSLQAETTPLTTADFTNIGKGWCLDSGGNRFPYDYTPTGSIDTCAAFCTSTVNLVGMSHGAGDCVCYKGTVPVASADGNNHNGDNGWSCWTYTPTPATPAPPPPPAPAPSTLQFVKATMVFGLSCGYATLADVNFLSSSGASIDVKLANYQDDHRGSAWGACTLVDGNSNCWWEGYGGVAPQYTVHDPLTSRDPAFMDCVGPEPSPMEIRTLTVQGQAHPCQCTGGFYKGYPCQAANAADNQCHWFIFEVEGSETVSSVDVTANGCGYNSGLNYAEFTPCSSADVTTCTDEIIATVTRSDCSTAPAPAPVTASAGVASGGASAVGDPHLQNLHGERFDLMREGQHVLINIPRGQEAERALLRVQARARRQGGNCADIYFKEVNVTGSWAEAKRAGGFHYSAAHSATETPGWVAFGKVELKIVHGATGSGVGYLNVYVKHLGQAGSVVGGLLGEDDHGDVIIPPAACGRHMSLLEVPGDRKVPSVHSVAVASLE